MSSLKIQQYRKVYREIRALQCQLDREPPGWRRQRLEAIHLGICGSDSSLERIAFRSGFPTWVIELWFDWFFDGGLRKLLGAQRLEPVARWWQPLRHLRRLIGGKARRANPRCPNAFLQVALRQVKPSRYFRFPW